MRATDITWLFDYLYWLRDRILAAAQTLPSDVFVSSDTVTTRDLRGTLVHELDVEWSWRVRLRGGPPEAWGPDVELKPADYATVDQLAEHWRRDEAEMRSWLANLSDEALAEPSDAEASKRLPLWFYLMHMFSHGMQQFSDTAVLLTRVGASPGDVEFLDYADGLVSGS